LKKNWLIISACDLLKIIEIGFSFQRLPNLGREFRIGKRFLDELDVLVEYPVMGDDVGRQKD
jgi:hypothetical protein